MSPKYADPVPPADAIKLIDLVAELIKMDDGSTELTGFLAEVSKWIVEYGDLDDRDKQRKIEVRFFNPPNPDPPIIGIKSQRFIVEDETVTISSGKVLSIKEKLTAFLLGAFEETQFERLVRMKLTEKA